MSEASVHIPVLLGPAVEALQVRPGGRYLDATVGLGGHAAEILHRSSPDGRLFGLDADPWALEQARKNLAEYGGRVQLAEGNFSAFDELFSTIHDQKLDGIIADLGVSSLQLSDPSRGFSFQHEGPLDMRLGPSQGETLRAYLDRVTPEELRERLAEAGEERFAERLTRLILTRRDVWANTRDMARDIERTIPRRGRSHPATRVFLAFRMAVNRESENLKRFLEKAPEALAPGGRLVVISFHSTEDRIVKYAFRGPEPAEMRRVTKSPIVPSREEMKTNPRSRSAKMRVFEKTDSVHELSSTGF
jgi:16S rRNA (cytosine1402-N4)-methyltransferase